MHGRPSFLLDHCVEGLRTREIDEAWRESAIARIQPAELVLVTDFDGTLADIVPDPTLAVALPESLRALRRLAQRLSEVIVLSSRTNPELEALVPVPGLRLIGDGGRPMPGPVERRALDHFNSEATRLLVTIPGAWLEVKPASSAVHFRNTDRSGEDVFALLRPLLKATGLAGMAGRKVVEFHVPDVGKGSALTAMLPALKPGGLVCFGDDENDRSMFEVVSRLAIPHMCVGVSSMEAPADLFHRCDLVVSGPPEAAALLNTMAEWASTSPSAGILAP